MSWRSTTREEAELRAIQDCEYNVRQAYAVAAVDCRVVVSVSDAFLALVQADDGAWAASGGNTENEAEEKALEKCRQVSANPNTCHVTFRTHTNGQGVGSIPLKGVVLAGS